MNRRIPFFSSVLCVCVFLVLACGSPGSDNIDLQKKTIDSVGTTESDSCLFLTDLDSFPKTTESSLVNTKRALVIGLGMQEDQCWAKINGDKDVPYVKEMLTNLGYTDLRTLVNRQATKKGIVSAFNALAASCQEGDMVYIHFSGHGQQVTDVNGDEPVDGLDESWIPYDAYLVYGDNDKGEKHLIDDEINALLTAINDKIGERGKLLVVVDACHSGDSQRGDDLDEMVRGVYDDFVIPMTTRGHTKKPSAHWLTLSACKDFQLNQELKKPQVGKLTYTLYVLSKEGNVSMEKIEGLMGKYRSRLPQAPDLSGESISYTISDFFK